MQDILFEEEYRVVIILITGLTGAGKTTYCRNYANTKNAKSYSIDNWMRSLFWQDMPNNPDMQWFVDNQDWYLERVARCEELIKKEIVELSQANIDVLLDLGFTSSEHRRTYIDLANSFDVSVELHHLDVDSETRWKRVQKRNELKSDTYAMEVTRDMFDYIENIFEDFSKDEIKFLKRVN